jgi:chemotaxis protein CheD
MVGIAEQLVSADPDDVLVTLGLGSCIGLAVVDVTARVAGLSHIVLPEWSGGKAGSAPRSKFADTAVRALLEAVTRAGGRPGHLTAVLCGGASMFPGAPGMGRLAQIGERNTARTLAELAAHRIAVRGRDTGGSSGRSVEVRVATGQVLVRAARHPPRAL